MNTGSAPTTDEELAMTLNGVGEMNEHMINRRVAEIANRSYKNDTQAAGVDLAISCIDLTTLEGADTARRVERLVAKAVHPDPHDPQCPSVAAICVYPERVKDAREALDRLDARHVHLASVATGFPSGLTPLRSRLIEIEEAIADGADEIDTVLDRAALLSGQYSKVTDRVRAEKEACGDTKLKVILETAELEDLTWVWHAATLAIDAGADVIKTSTGKGPGGATLPVAWVMGTAARMGFERTGRPIGVKISGGVRDAKTALKHLAIAIDTMGTDQFGPDRFRIGASALLDDLVAQRRFHATGRYHSPEHFPLG